MQYLRSPLFPISLLSLLFLLFQWKTILHTPAPGTDFSIYYHAAGQFKDNPSGLYQSTQTAFDQYLYPPPSILLFRIFSLFPERTSYFIFTGTMYLSLLAALLTTQSLITQSLTPKSPTHQPLTTQSITAQPPTHQPLTTQSLAGYLLFAFASAPVYHNISLGQINCLVLLLSMLYLYFGKKKPALAGLLLAAAIWIKIYPVLLLLPALLSREGRATFLFCMAGTALILVITLPWVPLHLYVDFAKKMADLSRYTSAHIINQSVTAFGIRGSIPFQRSFQWPNIYLVPGWLKITNYLIMAVVLVTTMAKAASDRPIVWGAIILAAGALFSPLGWGHAFVFCLPLLMISLERIERSIPRRPLNYALFFVTALLFLIPVHNHPAFLDQWPALIQNIYYSRFLCITLLLIFFALHPSTAKEMQPQRITGK
jgi:hypothetical protein